MIQDPGEPSDSKQIADSDGIVRTNYDWSSTPPSTGVVEAVADASGRDPTALGPIYETIDPDALDKLIRSKRERRPAGDVSVSLTYVGYDVTVRGDGSVVVRTGTIESGSD